MERKRPLVSAKGEEVRVLEEEVPFLGKEERKPRQIHLAFIHLRLCEVCIDGQRAGQRRCNAVKKIKSRFEIEVVPATVRFPAVSRDEKRFNLKAHSLVNVRETLQLTKVCEGGHCLV